MFLAPVLGVGGKTGSPGKSKYIGKVRVAQALLPVRFLLSLLHRQHAHEIYKTAQARVPVLLKLNSTLESSSWSYYNDHSHGEHTMKQMRASAFKARCLKIMNEIQATGEPVIVTKHGKPVVKVIPIKPENDDIFGFMAGKAKIIGDIESPVVPLKDWNIFKTKKTKI
jgi:prevent-host-death family protein